MQDKEYAKGIYFNAPKIEWKKCEISIDKRMMLEWLNSKLDDGEKYLKIDVKESKDGTKWYGQVNDWKPKEQETSASPEAPFEDKIPF